MKRLATVLCVLACSAGAYAGSTAINVNAWTDQIGSPLDTGIMVNAGDWLTINCHVDDTWSLGSDVPSSRMCNADGLTAYPEYDRTGDLGLSANYGAMVGQIGDGGFFLVGTSFHSDSVSDTGNLKLFCWDSSYTDNWGAIEARVSAPSVPAPGALLLSGLGTGLVGWLRRKVA